ncbi:MAG: CBS domain-containing protein [Actinomycetota bacterium]|nr:CBS domain-containing protein [Actinomycetota bacterium]
MPRSLISACLVVAPLLDEEQTVGEAVGLLASQELPALPVVDGPGRLVGIFGEREFIAALFPQYLGTLRSAAFVRASLDDALERRLPCRGEPVSRYMNTEHVDVPEDVSDVQLAEIFLHHRVLIAPVVRGGEPVGVVPRSAFFRALAARLGELG